MYAHMKYGRPHDGGRCDFWNRWTREHFIEHLELIWPQTVSVAYTTFLEAIRDLYVQYDMSDATEKINWHPRFYKTLACSTERVRITTLLRPLFFFTVFLFRATIVIEGEGIGARSVRFPHRCCVCPTRSRK